MVRITITRAGPGRQRLIPDRTGLVRPSAIPDRPAFRLNRCIKHMQKHVHRKMQRNGKEL